MTKKCRACHVDKNTDEFPFFSTKEAGRKNTCRSCSRYLSQIRKKLKSQNRPPLSGPCPICGEHTDTWILDHCHFTDVFRGYICNNCNLGLGRFNDDARLLKNAIFYLEDGQESDYNI